MKEGADVYKLSLIIKKKLVRWGRHLFNELPLLRNVVCVIGVRLFNVLFYSFVKNRL